MNKYQNKKAELHELALAIWLRFEFTDKNHSSADLAVWTEFFTQQGRHFELLREFRENGII